MWIFFGLRMEPLERLGWALQMESGTVWKFHCLGQGDFDLQPRFEDCLQPGFKDCLVSALSFFSPLKKEPMILGVRIVGVVAVVAVVVVVGVGAVVVVVGVVGVV